ncbi:glutaminase [Celeribacter sp.]|uniref:glutaminase n=1 Tax=Celeribacter sp. TaxID=1890673 RepID=UPI003A8F8AFD
MALRVRAAMEAISLAMADQTDRGEVAFYIPELATSDPQNFAMSVSLASGEQISVGTSDTAFSIQSISKIFTLAIALGRFGDGFWRRVGREPSTMAFNSIQELEIRKGRPANPFVNAGAITTTDMILAGSTPAECIGEILQFVRLAASDDEIFVNPAVAASETATGHKNWALAHVLTAFGNLEHPCEMTLGVYFHQCAIAMTCAQLARCGRFLAGFDAEQDLVAAKHVRSINALMMTCGHYNGSGEFAYRVGIPSKSGVGGGILAIVPHVASIAVWSPGLDRDGNSLLGIQALELLSESMGWSLFQGATSSLDNPLVSNRSRTCR